MEYNFREIEPRWQKEWERRRTYRVDADASRPKYYVLDMFPYPSGAGLHVGHPLGYIASDIYTRYKRLCGFNVLHPMGFDAFGLPAEQYAIQTGQHPAVTTAQNVARYREQLDKLGFSYDWDRQVVTSDPAYYRWTLWAFLKMFDSYYCYDRQQARPIAELTEAFGRKVATAAEARAMMKIGTWYDSVEETLQNLGLPPNRTDGQPGFLVMDTDGKKGSGPKGGDSHPMAYCMVSPEAAKAAMEKAGVKTG